MAISVSCPGCARRFRIDDKHAGKRVACPECQQRFEVPVQSDANTPLAAEADAEQAPPSVDRRRKPRPKSEKSSGVSTPEVRRKSGMKSGYWLALAGLGAFLSIVLLATAIGARGDVANVLVALAFFLMAAGFWVGTAIVGVQKGYNVVVGIVLGFFAPLGLLILTLMPDLSKSGKTA